MNKLMLTIVAMAFIGQVNAQKVTEKDVPQPASAGFFKAHPTVKETSWMREGNNYVVGYEEDKVKKYATYSDSGLLIEHGTDIVQSALPAQVMDYVKINYNEDEVKNACKVVDSYGVVTYDVEVKGMDLTFDARGNYLKGVKKA